jgi:hypothetical protein
MREEEGIDAKAPVLARLNERVQVIVKATPAGTKPSLATVQRGVELQRSLNFALELHRKRTQGAGSPERAEEIARELLDQMNSGQAGGVSTANSPIEPADQVGRHEAALQPEEAIHDPHSCAVDDEAIGELFEDANAGDETIDLDLGMSEPARQEAQAVEPVEVAGQEPAPGTAAARMRALLKESGLG